ncbi:MAG: N-acyl homoserine lactonase family protein [Planctomycetes bacterium]|nr:N-acyl homoserine lactonase family protein [Planctomycetota bacterium]
MSGAAHPAAFAASLLAAACATVGQPRGVVDRLYVFEVGECHAQDVSRWTGTAEASRPWVFANHCYLIRHRHGLLLWETGFADEIAAMPDGLALGDSIRVRVRRPLIDQLRDIGIAPGDITHLALSHFHIDHAGNSRLFAGATLLVQAAEHAAAFGPTPEKFGYDANGYAALRGGNHVLLHGDQDVFGDGSCVLLATPGHTPGHQSLLVRLAGRRPLLLSGDVVHMQSNWQQRRTPISNFDRAMTVRSMARVQALLQEHGATLVIQHDGDSNRQLPKAPAWLD